MVRICLKFFPHFFANSTSVRSEGIACVTGSICIPSKLTSTCIMPAVVASHAFAINLTKNRCEAFSRSLQMYCDLKKWIDLKEKFRQ